MNGWDRIYEAFSERFFAPAFYIICVSVAFVTGFISHRNSKLGKVFLVYLAVDMIMFYLDNYIEFFSGISKKEAHFFVNTTNILISIIEIGVYLLFFRLILRNKRIKLFITLFQIIFPLLVISLFLMNSIESFKFISWLWLFDLIGTFELLILIVPAFVFYIELFSLAPKEILANKPTFWITTGIFLFSILSIPYYTISHYLFETKYRYVNAIAAPFFYLPLSFNYILLSRAFICKRPLTA